MVLGIDYQCRVCQGLILLVFRVVFPLKNDHSSQLDFQEV
jgi:hypothetical protein